MGFRCLIFIALLGCVYLAACDEVRAESFSSAIAQLAPDGSAAAKVSSKGEVKAIYGKKCRKVKRCGRNEEFSYCTQSIGRAQYCSQDGLLLATRGEGCPCKEGCVCKEDYLRNDNGTCVLDRECSQDCGPTERLDDCPVDCASDYCPISEEDASLSCPAPDTDDCSNPVCKCGFNYRRADNGTCIPTRNCPPFDCSARPNEEYNPCPPLCPTDDCSQATPTGECPAIFGNIGIVLECNPTCRCKKGFWRKDGICVPYGDCPNVCPPNQVYSDCKQALCRAQNCTQKGQPIACPLIVKKDCHKGCVCKSGFLKLSNGTCVPEDQCASDTPVCGDNEILNTCPSLDSNDYCPKREQVASYLPAPDKCLPPKCECRINYKRADNGTCIPIRDCPPFDCSARPNEVYSPCPPLCPSDACGLPRLRNKCPFRIGILLICNPKCQCKDGYGRSNGICVPFEECPDLCPTNQEYNSCTQGLCRSQDCTTRNDPVACVKIDPKYCKRDCVCKENYYKNENGTCVTADQCDAGKCPNPNEVYSLSTRPKCPKLGTCESIVARIRCEEPEEPGCTCQDGYLRFNETSSCIPICDCPQMKSAPECSST